MCGIFESKYPCCIGWRDVEVYQGCRYVIGMFMDIFVCMYFHCCFGLHFNLHRLVP
jgi:hypothetical protein